MAYSIATHKNYYFTLDREKIYALSQNDTIGERIKKIRKIKELTAKELGEKIGISSAGVISYENGNAYPSALIISKLYNLFNTDIVCDDYSDFITSKYWEKFKKWRKEKNLTKKEAAEVLGVSESTYLCWENQKTYIAKHTFKKLRNKFKDMQLTT